MNDVILGLKCCAHPHDGEACGDCPYNYETGCIGQLTADTLDILTKLQKENEALKAELRAAKYNVDERLEYVE